MVRNFRKPLVVVGPKTLLRLPAAASALSDMAPGTGFRPVLVDSTSQDPAKVTRVVFVSGKHYYALRKHAEEAGAADVAFVRLEQLCPFPTGRLQEAVAAFPKAKSFVWSQEEHRNQGAWTFVSPRFRNLVGVDPEYRGRGVLCQPAVGVGQVHQLEAKMVVESAFQ